jgi:hypothetical protein
VVRVVGQKRKGSRLKKNKVSLWNLVPFTVARLAERIRSKIIPHPAKNRWLKFQFSASVSRLEIKLRKNSYQLVKSSHPAKGILGSTVGKKMCKLQLTTNVDTSIAVVIQTRKPKTTRRRRLHHRCEL